MSKLEDLYARLAGHIEIIEHPNQNYLRIRANGCEITVAPDELQPLIDALNSYKRRKAARQKRKK